MSKHFIIIVTIILLASAASIAPGFSQTAGGETISVQPTTQSNNLSLLSFPTTSYIGLTGTSVPNFSGNTVDAGTIRLLQSTVAEQLSDDPIYARARRLRNAGIGLFTTSLAGPIIGGGLMSGGAYTAATSTTNENLGTSLGIFVSGAFLTGVTAPLFVPGLVMWIIGQVRMNNQEDITYQRSIAQ